MIYMLVYETPPDDLEGTLAEHWENRWYRLSDTVAFVQESNGSVNTNAITVAEKVGMTLEGRQVGAVFPIRGLWGGFHNKELWEWLHNAESNGG
ncbi:MAG: hypothetical protein F4Z41_05025 [Acidimicrobiia bacterium]|nr:hypothetical protein [bacterium]MXX00005.1 hypothetical protein [Acidimicrobiia bacterium]MDE0675513.1 hypothetical protein [bacterium]MXX45550.1 hypothetical protein [Acidimicrobiia bacterium]MYA38578.1 hypothetical protein [Acidimicrobiia bacterium]